MRGKSGITERLTAVPLVNRVLNPDPAKAVMVVSENKEEQDGFYNLCKGMMLWHRNPVHHGLDAKLTRGDALKICAFVDLLLPVPERAKVKTAAT